MDVFTQELHGGNMSNVTFLTAKIKRIKIITNNNNTIK